ncbi:MAG: pyridoxamine 5'-phosphate oxidase family protein, partial [Thermodesulfobacteriota bacterium]|nr:pyridoxamine 5'-phosphate oxidase family protein [Thermodesulfobacteriota bacterium]
MRRKDKEITDRDIIDSIIIESKVCRLGLSEENQSYIVPLSFGYDGSSLYFHGFPEGKKIDILRKNSNVCFEFDSDSEPIQSDSACSWSVRYKSVIGYGKARFIEDIDSKIRALEIIMGHYSEQSFAYPEKTVEKIAVIQVDIETI